MRVWCIFENHGKHVRGKLQAITIDLDLLDPDEIRHVEQWEVETGAWDAVNPEGFTPLILLGEGNDGRPEISTKRTGSDHQRADGGRLYA